MSVLLLAECMRRRIPRASDEQLPHHSRLSLLLLPFSVCLFPFSPALLAHPPPSSP